MQGGCRPPAPSAPPQAYIISPEDKGEPGLYLQYEDSTEEWTAMSIFWDTVEPIPKPTKRMKHAHNMKVIVTQFYT